MTLFSERKFKNLKFVDGKKHVKKVTFDGTWKCSHDSNDIIKSFKYINMIG